MTATNKDDATIRALIREAVQNGSVHRELTVEEAEVMKILVAMEHFVEYSGPWTTGVPQPNEYTLTTSALVLIEAFGSEDERVPERSKVAREGAAPGWELSRECYFRLDDAGHEFDEMWDVAEREAEIFVAPLRERLETVDNDRKLAIKRMAQLTTERDEARARLEEMRTALERVDEALRGVQATEAGGITGDPRVDAIAALRAEARSICDHLAARGDYFMKTAETFTGERGAQDRLMAIGSALREESRRIRGGNYDR